MRTTADNLLRVTLQVEIDENTSALLAANLRKLPIVMRVDNVTALDCVFRELAVIKVAATSEERADIAQIAKVFRSRIVDICSGSVVVEATGVERKIDALVEVLSAYGIIDITRTGQVAMPRSLRTLRRIHGSFELDEDDENTANAEVSDAKEKF